MLQASTFFRRTIFDRAGGFRPENRVSWDGELFLEMALAKGNFAIVDEFWSGYRIHSESITGSKTNTIRIMQSHDAIFERVMGREPRKYDRLIALGYRMLRHFLNPLDTWERIRRGPVFGRPIDD